ncbi:hypothetical protein [Parasutterella muris]|uniref:hypothetical protein n=1 Tax=Parasutterella muris TaxID=2565572 RepID=UPI002041C483|nr:hypothetical protein [Parasutterella muris]
MRIKVYYKVALQIEAGRNFDAIEDSDDRRFTADFFNHHDRKTFKILRDENGHFLSLECRCDITKDYATCLLCEVE